MGPDRALWFTEGNAIGRMTTSGAFTNYSIPTSGSAPSAITAWPGGAVWFTEPGVNKIGRIAVVPTSKNQCKSGGWRNYGSKFKTQGQCVAFVVKQAVQKCLTERARIGLVRFRNKYGLGCYHVLALLRCINQTSR